MTAPYVKRRLHNTGGMTAAPCIRCGHFWTHNSGFEKNFTIITKYCPTCVTHLPVLGGAA
jgi:hypothetical protein